MTDRQVTRAHVYDIIGHRLSEGEAAPDGIVEYTKELIQIRLELEDLERQSTELSVSRYGLNSEEELEHPFEAIWYLFNNIGEGVTKQDNITELEQKHQSLLNRIANVRDAMITRHVSRVKSIDPSNYSSRLSQEGMRKWSSDGTFLEQIEKLEAAADRVDRRIAAKRETANARLSFTVSLLTVFISTLLLAFALLSFLVSLMSLANVFL